MIEDICTNEKYSFTGGPFGSNLKVSDYTQSGVRVIQLNNINDIYFNDDNKVFVSVKKADSLKSCNAYSGDLIFAKMMPAGRLCILPKTYDRYLLGSDAIRLKPNIDKYYCFFLLECLNRTIIRNSITSKTSGSTRQRIGLLDLKKTSFYCPNYIEQKQIGLFFELIESKISNISKKINILKKYKEGFTKRLAKTLNTDEIALSSICSITTGKMDANAMNPQGKYKFFTCSREDYFIDTYAFDCEALLVSGNGEVGLTKYYNGKFNAYQRTYVLYNLKRNAKFIKLFIDLQINTIIRKETNKGAMPYIRLTTFNKIMIPNIDQSLEYLISIVIDKIDKKIELLQNHARVLNNIKNNLLGSLFI